MFERGEVDAGCYRRVVDVAERVAIARPYFGTGVTDGSDGKAASCAGPLLGPAWLDRPGNVHGCLRIVDRGGKGVEPPTLAEEHREWKLPWRPRTDQCPPSQRWVIAIGSFSVATAESSALCGVAAGRTAVSSPHFRDGQSVGICRSSVYPLRMLREPTFLILAAVAPAPLHGYGILRSVQRLSDNRVRLRAGTLYTALDRMVRDGWLERDREEVVDGRLRRYYRITSTGNEALRSAAAHLETNAGVARRQMALRPGGAST